MCIQRILNPYQHESYAPSVIVYGSFIILAMALMSLSFIESIYYSYAAAFVIVLPCIDLCGHILREKRAATRRRALSESTGIGMTARNQPDRNADSSASPLPGASNSNVPPTSNTSPLPGDSNLNVPPTSTTSPLPGDSNLNVPSTSNTSQLPGSSNLNVPPTSSTSQLPGTSSLNVPSTSSTSQLPGTSSLNVPSTSSTSQLPGTSNLNVPPISVTDYSDENSQVTVETQSGVEMTSSSQSTSQPSGSTASSTGTSQLFPSFASIVPVIDEEDSSVGNSVVETTDVEMTSSSQSGNLLAGSAASSTSQLYRSSMADVPDIVEEDCSVGHSQETVETHSEVEVTSSSQSANQPAEDRSQIP